MSYGLSAAPAGGDLLLGVASLDLSSLTLLGCVDGWYNILNAQQQTRGQIKVGVSVGRGYGGMSWVRGVESGDTGAHTPP